MSASSLFSASFGVVLSLLSWLFCVAVLGGLLAYFVHGLLVRSDYREYKRLGGQLKIWDFRQLRQRVKKDYRVQRELAQTHQAHRQLSPSLAGHIRCVEASLTEKMPDTGDGASHQH